MLRSADYRPGARSLTELFRDLFDQSVETVRDETRLARAEMGEKLAQASNALVSLAVALVLAIGAVVMMLFAASAALALIWPTWLATLVVGAVALLLALILALAARSKLRARNFIPHRTIHSVRADARMAKENLS